MLLQLIIFVKQMHLAPYIPLVSALWGHAVKVKVRLVKLAGSVQVLPTSYRAHLSLSSLQMSAQAALRMRMHAPTLHILCSWALQLLGLLQVLL